MNRIKEIFPPVEQLLDMEPEEIGPFLLEFFNIIDGDPTSSKLNRYNFTLETNPDLRDYSRERINEVAKVMTEAWVWLENEGMIAPAPGDTGNFSFLTRRGKKLHSHTDFTKYQSGKFLPKYKLDPVLVQKVWPLFLRGDYDLAIFQSYKEVEVRIRKVGRYGDDVLGVALARKAFHPETGPLTNKSDVESEKEAIMHLFAGALGAFKNPNSHRDVNFGDPEEVAELILFANYLLRVIDSRTRSK